MRTDSHEPDLSRRWGIACGLGAAATFGFSAPLAKQLLPDWSPLALTAALYLGAGAFLTLVRGLRRAAGMQTAEAPLRRPDLPRLVAVALIGGFVGPLLMLHGLERVSGLAGSLLLNLEMPFTILLAVTVWREHLGSREALAAAVILSGAALLAGAPGEARADIVGVFCLAGACLAWALDNNLTQRLSGRDPVALTQVKTLGSGTLAAVLVFQSGASAPSDPLDIGVAVALGSVSYGLSVLLDAYALRALGAAREAAIFATAPFAGALLAVPLLGDRPSAVDALAGLLMACGVLLVVRARHAHPHMHEAFEHEHRHVHDAHHRHDHTEPVTEPHSHPHRHQPLEHAHPHVSDAHHRHRH